MRATAGAVVVMLLGGLAHAVAPQRVAGLAWLAGCWATPGAEAGSGEMWTVPAGGTMLGVSRTVKGGKTVAWEFMQIREEADGLTFVAKPSGQPEATFRAASVADTRVVFENPAHDFPQRVIYERQGPAGVAGRIEGTRDGRTLAIDFPLTRIECR